MNATNKGSSRARKRLTALKVAAREYTQVVRTAEAGRQLVAAGKAHMVSLALNQTAQQAALHRLAEVALRYGGVEADLTGLGPTLPDVEGPTLTMDDLTAHVAAMHDAPIRFMPDRHISPAGVQDPADD